MPYPKLPSSFLAAALLLVIPGRAAQWTVTSYYAVKPTESVLTSYSRTYTYTRTYGLESGVTPTDASPIETSTTAVTYKDLEVVQVYVDGNDVDTDDIKTTTTYEYDNDITRYIQPVVYTAPSSCPTPFTISTSTTIYLPTEVADQLTAASYSTSTVDYGTSTYKRIYAYFDSQVATVSSTDRVASLVAKCTDPADYGRYDPDDNDNSRSNWDACWNDSYCNSLAIYVIVLAAVIPALFLLGFIENYFWFRRMMIGKFSLRFGTVSWMLILWPVLCFTKQCPSRDQQTQTALREQWKNVGFGKALGLWFRWGFRRRYPVELLGYHPLYNNPSPPPTWTGQGPPPGYQPQAGYAYYAPGAVEGGQQMQPPPGMVMYQPPPQAYQGSPYPPPAGPGPDPSAHPQPWSAPANGIAGQGVDPSGTGAAKTDSS